METTTDRRVARDRGAPRVTGWVWFAGLMLVVAGGFNLINGFAAIERGQYYNNHIVYSNLKFWGWMFVIWGVLQLFAGFASIAGQMTGNYVGVMLASAATFLWFIMIFAAPWAALLGVIVNVLIIYGLTNGAEPQWNE
jgi:hypothetical protein